MKVNVYTGIIEEATERELVVWWSKHYADIISFTDWLKNIQRHGTKIIEEKESK